MADTKPELYHNKILNGLYAAAGGAILATGLWLVSQAFDWNKWRGNIDHRMAVVEKLYRQDIQEIKRGLRDMNLRLDKMLRDRSNRGK